MIAIKEFQTELMPGWNREIFACIAPLTKKKIGKKKSGSALLSPDKHKTVPKGRRFLPSFWKWLMTRGARRWS
jgi:hypothetical protein